MISNPPQDCCTQGLKFEGTPLGSLIDIGSVNTYVTGDKTSHKVILFLTDVLGHKFLNAQLVADAFAEAGYYVVVPDLFNGDPTKFGEGIPEGWFERHGVEQTDPYIQQALKYIKSELNPKFIGTVGYCFGGRYVVRLLAGNEVDAGATAHPSFIQLNEVEKIKKPLIILGAEEDPIYTPELRSEVESKLKEIEATYHTTLSSGVKHGFAVRGNIKDKWGCAMAEKALKDTIWWFQLFE